MLRAKTITLALREMNFARLRNSNKIRIRKLKIICEVSI